MFKYIFTIVLVSLMSFNYTFSADEFSSPEEVRSVNGVLSYELNVVLDSVEIGGRKILTRLYNGNSTGPTFRLKPGDIFRVKLNNNMPPNPDENEMPPSHNFPNKINTINLHTHGLSVSPKDSSDNPFIQVKPGESFQYNIKIPLNHQEGTFWYHSHRHGSIWAQLSGGLSGTLIIEGMTDEIPAIKSMTEKIMVIQSFFFDKTHKFPYPNFKAPGIVEIFPTDSLQFTLNGKTSGVINMKPGEIQRWRVVNAHMGNFEYLTTFNENGIIPLYYYAIDGINLSQPAYQDSVLLAAGNRVDVFFKAPSKPGLCTLRIVDVEPFTKAVTNYDLIVINVQGEPNEMALPSSIPTPERYKIITDDEITNQRTMIFSNEFTQSPINIFYIDDKLFDENHTDIAVKEGDVEEWKLINPTEEVHPFHLHINPILVTEINNVKQNPPYWCDVINIPPKGSLKFRTRFEEFDGKTVLHCHNVLHEDLGMMQVIEIQPKPNSVDDENPIDLKGVYPNPVVGNIQNLNFELPEFLHNKSIDVEIFDITGKRLYENSITGQKENQLSVDISGFTKGSYFYKVSSGKYNNMNKFIILK
jgi:FtsP/CotA-like multicopper oxidase with cupredoxin domain